MASTMRPDSPAETPEPPRGPIVTAAYLHADRLATRDDRAAAWVEANAERCEGMLAIEGLNGGELLARIDAGHTSEQDFTARMHGIVDTLHVQVDRMAELAEELHGAAL